MNIEEKKGEGTYVAEKEECKNIMWNCEKLFRGREGELRVQEKEREEEEG